MSEKQWINWKESPPEEWGYYWIKSASADITVAGIESVVLVTRYEDVPFVWFIGSEKELPIDDDDFEDIIYRRCE